MSFCAHLSPAPCGKEVLFLKKKYNLVYLPFLSISLRSPSPSSSLLYSNYAFCQFSCALSRYAIRRSLRSVDLSRKASLVSRLFARVSQQLALPAHIIDIGKICLLNILNEMYIATTDCYSLAVIWVNFIDYWLSISG